MTDRVRPALAVYLFGMLGVFLTVTPWTVLWNEWTRFLLPAVSLAWVRSGWGRGLVSGIGLLDLAVAVREAAALHRVYTQERRGERS